MSLASITCRAAVTACSALLAMFAMVAAADEVPQAEISGAPPTYVASTRTLVSGGVARTFILAVPSPYPDVPLPLVIAMHGHGGQSANLRQLLALETQAGGRAVFAYPQSPAELIDTSEAGRAAETAFTTDLVATLSGELSIDHSKVYLVGHSSGAILASAVGCRLGRSVVRGVGLHSGPQQSVNGDCDCPQGGLCSGPGALILWGLQDSTILISAGYLTADMYADKQQCSDSETPVAWGPTPCEARVGCARPVNQCWVPGQGHAIWSQAGLAIWTFIDGDETISDEIWADGFEASETKDNGVRSAY